MSGVASLLLETPALAFPSGYKGPIGNLMSYMVRRELDKAGSWTVQVPLADPNNVDVVAGWRATIRQEGNLADFAFDTLMYRGEVMSHRIVINEAGQAILELSGVTPLGILANANLHIGLDETNRTLAQISADIDSVFSYTVPTGKSTGLASMTLNEQTKLQALLKIAGYFHCSIADGFGDVITFTDQDDVPDSGWRFINVAQAGPELNQPYSYPTVQSDVIGFISGAPVVSYEGSQIVNKITPLGVDWDGAPLTLSGAVAYDSKYTVQSGTNPDGSTYYYISDATSITAHGEKETTLVRSDVKNPSNDQSTIAQAKGVLLAIASMTLLQRRSEVISLGVEIVNGFDCWVLPGQRVRVRYVGVAQNLDGSLTWLNLDRDFLVVGRTDIGDASGQRTVHFDLATISQTYTIPNLPTAVPMPTPRPQDRQTSEPKPIDKTKSKDRVAPRPISPIVPSVPLVDAIARALADLTNNNGAYQSCCADQTSHHGRNPYTPTLGNGIPGGIQGASGAFGASSNVANGAGNGAQSFAAVTGSHKRLYFLNVGVTAGSVDTVTGPTGFTWHNIASGVWYAIIDSSASAGNALIHCTAGPGTNLNIDAPKIDIDSATAPIYIRYALPVGTTVYVIRPVDESGTPFEIEGGLTVGASEATTVITP